jgi:hypothetical protein
MNSVATSRGQWSDEEHVIFLAAFKQHGKNWTKIAKAVGSRNNIQCRTHSQKLLTDNVEGGGKQRKSEISRAKLLGLRLQIIEPHMAVAPIPPWELLAQKGTVSAEDIMFYFEARMRAKRGGY